MSWRALDPAVRGPERPFELPPGATFSWGRQWGETGAIHHPVPMPTWLSATAIRVSHQVDPAHGSRVFVATSQGGVRSYGGLQVFEAEGGLLLHRLSESGTPAVRLGPGTYRLTLSVDDPVCEMTLSIASQSPPPDGSATAADLRTRHVWRIEEFFETPVGRHAEYAVSLLALAAVDFADLRGDKAPSDFFQELVMLLLDQKPHFASRMLKAITERRHLEIPKGSVQLREVARYRRENLGSTRRSDLHTHLRSRLADG